MTGIDDVRNEFKIANQNEVEACLGRHPRLIEHLLDCIPIIKKHLPETISLHLKHQDLGFTDGDLTICILLPGEVGAVPARQRLALIDNEWWMKMPIEERMFLMADVRWNLMDDR